MRLAVLADVHGNLPALEAVLADAARVRVDAIVVAGDLTALPYDHARLRAAFHDSGLLAAGGGFARAILRGMETGLNVAGFLVDYAFRLAAEAGYGDSEVVPDELWDQAVAIFDWEHGRAPR